MRQRCANRNGVVVALRRQHPMGGHPGGAVQHSAHPTAARAVPCGPDLLHEIKYDGFRLRAERSGDRVRLITRGGYAWTRRYPWIVEAALKNRHKHFVARSAPATACA